MPRAREDAVLDASATERQILVRAYPVKRGYLAFMQTQNDRGAAHVDYPSFTFRQVQQ
jgi:hypothetical protein